MTKNQKLIVAFPIFYGICLSVLIFLQVNLFSSDLTRGARDLLTHTMGEFFFSTLFLLIPNFLLSFFLLSYAKAHPEYEKSLFMLCVCSLAVATVFSLSILIFYYAEFSQIPIVMFGFPVTYFFGICIGYVVGVTFVGLKR